MNLRKAAYGLFFFITIYGYGFSQDVEFSQYYGNPLYLNPALTGVSDDPRLALNFRSAMPVQWGDYITYSASFDQYTEALHGGVGIQLFNDRQGQGALNSYHTSLNYSYISDITPEITASAGFKTAFNYRFLDVSGLTFPDMNGTSGITNEVITAQSNYFFDFSFGLMLWNRKGYLGIAADHLTEPNQSLQNNYPVPLFRKYSLHAGHEIILYDRLERPGIYLSPNIIAQYQNGFTKINYGVYLHNDMLTAGLWVRQDLLFNISDVVIMLGYSDDYFTLAYSYDIPVNKYQRKNPHFGAHEVTFLLNLQYKETRKKIRAIKCPKI